MFGYDVVVVDQLYGFGIVDLCYILDCVIDLWFCSIDNYVSFYNFVFVGVDVFVYYLLIVIYMFD